MRKILFVVLLQVFAVSGLFAQFVTPESRHITLLKSKTLLVPIKEEVTRTLLDLQEKPEELKKYKEAIANYNALMKKTIERFWDFGRDIEFMEETKVKNIIDEGNTRYAVLHSALRSEKFINQLKYIDVYASGPYDSDARRVAKSEGYLVYSLLLPSRTGAETAYQVQLPVAYPSEGDMIFMVQRMMTVFKTMYKKRDYLVQEFEAEVAANNADLKKRTILIDKNQLAPKEEIEDLRKKYPYAIEIVDYAEINRAITEQDSGYAYVQVIPMVMPNNKIDNSKINLEFMHLVVDAHGGRVLGTCKPGRISYDQVAEDISKREVGDYIKKF